MSSCYLDSILQGTGTSKQSFSTGGKVDVPRSKPKFAPVSFIIASIFNNSLVIPSVLPNRAKIRVYKLENERQRVSISINSIYQVTLSFYITF